MNETNLGYEIATFNGLPRVRLKVSRVIFFGARYGVDQFGQIWHIPIKSDGMLDTVKASHCVDITLQALCDLFAATEAPFVCLEEVTILKDSREFHLAKLRRLDSYQIDLGG